MAILLQPSLFAWEEIEELGHLHRLTLVLESLPDEPLMRKLERARGKGRNDYPIRGLQKMKLRCRKLAAASSMRPDPTRHLPDT